MPATFNTVSKSHIQNFIKDNKDVLNTATKTVWANEYYIESGKPFSSLILYLTDPVAEN